MLEEDMCTPLGLTQTANPGADIEIMVRTAAQHWGGLESLMDGLGLDTDDLDDDEELWAVRSVVLDLVAEPLLQVPERTSLRQLIRRAGSPEPARLRRMHQAVAPNLAVRREIRSLHDVLWELDELPAFYTPVPPLMVLVGLLRRDWDGDIAERAGNWVKQLARRLNIDEADLRESTRRAVERLDATPFLIAKLDDSFGERHLLLSLSLRYALDEEHIVLHQDDVQRTADQVERLLSEKLTGHGDLPHRDLVIEFAIPRRLVNWPFDHWLHRDLPLGTMYPVTIRVDDVDLVQNDPVSLDSRQAKDDWYARHGQEPNAHAVFWDPDVDQVEMWTELVSRPECVCVVLATPPTPGDPATWTALRLAVSAGAFAVLWSRTTEVPPEWETQVIRRLREAPPCEHLHTVRRVRIEARARGGGPRHPGHDLSLYRDDGNRRRTTLRTDLVFPH